MVPRETQVLRFRHLASSPYLCTSSGSVNPFSHAGSGNKMSYFVDSPVSGPAPYSAVRPAVTVSGAPSRPSPGLPCLPPPLASCVLACPRLSTQGPNSKVTVSLASRGGARLWNYLSFYQHVKWKSKTDGSTEKGFVVFLFQRLWLERDERRKWGDLFFYCSGHLVTVFYILMYLTSIVSIIKIIIFFLLHKS